MSRASQLSRIRELRRLEEQQQAALLASGKKKLEQVDEALHSLKVGRLEGRTLFGEGSRKGDLASRIAGAEQIAYSTRKTGDLMRLKAYFQNSVEKLHEQFLSKRAERCQAESLLDAVLEEEATEADRKGQSALDEWYRSALEGLKGSRQVRERDEIC